MIYVLELLAVVIFGLIAFNIWRSTRGPQRTGALPSVDRTMLSPGRQAAEAIGAFDNVRSELKARYPATFAMLGGYMNSHTVAEVGGMEAAARQMIGDWSARREEVARELTRLLAENESEEEVRAIITAACDVDLDTDGARAWVAWLLSKLSV
ncbi:MAG: hypothetical protein ACKVS5_15245 [Parvularculaceae bacterium]